MRLEGRQGPGYAGTQAALKELEGYILRGMKCLGRGVTPDLCSRDSSCYPRGSPQKCLDTSIPTVIPWTPATASSPPESPSMLCFCSR